MILWPWLLVCLIVLFALGGGFFVNSWIFVLLLLAVLVAFVIPRGPRV
jgi:hypothetical protein